VSLITGGCDGRHFGGAVVSYQLSGVSCLLAAVRSARRRTAGASTTRPPDP